MAIHVHTSVDVGRREEENEDDDHQGRAPYLTLQQGANRVQSSPVNDNIAYDESDDSVERSGGSGFDVVRRDENTEDIGSYSCTEINDYRAGWSQSMLNSGKEKEGDDDVPKYVEEVDMDEDG